MKIFAQRHPILWSYLFFSYFSVSFQLPIYLSGMSGWVGLRQALIMSVLWLIPLLLWPNKSKLLAAIIGVILWATSIIAFGYWMIYGQDFSQSVIFIIFETNLTEGTEFILSYLRWWHVLAFLIFSVIPIILWRLMVTISLSSKVRYSYASLFALIISWPVLNTILIKDEGFTIAQDRFLHRIEPASPWNLTIGYLQYREQLQEMEKLLGGNHKLPPLEQFNVNPDTMPDTLVLVLGESTNSKRMSLYGYARPTTPKLDAMRDELIIFNDVITSRPYTIEALQQALSFADSKNTQAFFNQPTLLNIMKQAGYHITWITNQQTQTKRNTMLTMLSQLADEQIYLNNNRAQNASQYDSVVIAPLLSTLEKPEKKKMIIVHLLGTHRKYGYRYPEDYAKFTTDHDVPPWVGESNLEDYNSYDNAILYHDYVLAQLITTVQQHTDDALLVYFSDHGEEVYDYPEKSFAGRNEALPSPAMYTVPFFTWSSSTASNNTKQWSKYKNRPFSTADFIHTLPDMIGISFNGLDRSRSLISETFTAHTRWIGDPDQPKTLRDFKQIIR